MNGRSDYQSRLGQRLRDIRNQQGMTLQDVEDASEGKWKAVVIGAYERGDRAISAAKLADLASFYGVPVAELLPEPEPRAPRASNGESQRAPVMLDLHRLTSEEVSSQLKPISRYATTIQLQRGDYNGRVLTLRNDDVRALAVVFGVSAEDFVDRLGTEGVLADI